MDSLPQGLLQYVEEEEKKESYLLKLLDSNDLNRSLEGIDHLWLYHWWRNLSEKILLLTQKDLK
jgi:hypothetical protein